MAPTEHLLVLFSIILGLGITELLASIHDMLHPRTTMRWHWLPVLWAAQTFVSLIFWWWAMFSFAGLPELPNFFGLLLILLSPVTLYLLATSVLPDIDPGDAVDLKAFYFENRHRFFGLSATYTGVTWLQLILYGWAEQPGQHVWLGASLVMHITLARSDRPRLHAVLSIVIVTMSVLSVALYYLKIG